MRVLHDDAERGWGMVYQAGLGADTATAAAAINAFNPDADWAPVVD